MLAEKKDSRVGNQEVTEDGVFTTTRPSSDALAAAAVKRRPEDLTPRELEILRLIWDGHTNRSLAEQLNISMKTADTHRSNMMKKLRACNTAQLLKAALEGNLLETDSELRRSGRGGQR